MLMADLFPMLFWKANNKQTNNWTSSNSVFKWYCKLSKFQKYREK